MWRMCVCLFSLSLSEDWYSRSYSPLGTSLTKWRNSSFPPTGKTLTVIRVKYFLSIFPRRTYNAHVIYRPLGGGKRAKFFGLYTRAFPTDKSPISSRAVYRRLYIWQMPLYIFPLLYFRARARARENRPVRYDGAVITDHLHITNRFNWSVPLLRPGYVNSIMRNYLIEVLRSGR